MNPSQVDSQLQSEGQGAEKGTIIVLVTASSLDDAEKIGRTLVEKGLAACANILSPIKSIFVWEQKLTEETEVLLMLKTKRDLFSNVAEAVKKLHSYKVPEIIALPILAGTEDYLNWIAVNTRKQMK